MNGKKKYRAVEDLLTDDSFLAWYHRNDDMAIKAWETWMAASPKHQQLVNEAAYLLELLFSVVDDRRVTEDQLTTAKNKLFQSISK